MCSQVKDGERGEVYRKWSHSQHKRVAVAGEEEDMERGAAGGLAVRFDRKNRHTSFRRGSEAAGRGGSRERGRGGKSTAVLAGARNAGLKTEDEVRGWAGGWLGSRCGLGFWVWTVWVRLAGW